MASLSDLLTPSTKAEAHLALLGLLASGPNGFPIESWQEGNVFRNLTEAECQAYADLTVKIAAIAGGGLLDAALDAGLSDWLTLLAKSAYGIDRVEAGFTVGNATLTDGGAGPYTIVSGQLAAASADGLIYRNVDGGTLAQNGTLTLSWQAESPGVDYNVPANTLTTLVTSLAGVTIDNPIDLITQTWITTEGNDEESDASVVQRCKARWPELGSGATAAVYEKWAKEGSAEVVRVKVRENKYFSDGIVQLTIAGPSGAVSAQAVTDVDDYIEIRRPLCVRVDTVSAVNRNISISGTLYMRAAFAVDALAKATAAITLLQTQLGIGETVYGDKIAATIMGQPGSVNVDLASMADTVLAANEVPVFSLSLNVVGV